MLKIFVVFISLIFTIFSYSEDTKNVNSIMLIGNSFFYYNNSLHNHLGDIYDADPELNTPRRRSITINGSSLSWHDVESYLSNKEIGAFTIDSDTNTYEAYEDQDIDVVIMMDCSLCPINDKRKDSFYKYVKKHSETIRSKGIEPILFMTWPYKNKPEMQQQLEKEFFKASKLNKLRMIPAGQAFLYINQNFPNINLYTEDLRHPSKEGTYLAALMIFTSLSNKTPVGNSYIMGLDPDVAKILQEVAWLMHKDFQKRVMNSGL
jgi:hypothetical protein|tara:strand:- start:430 stop:1218 length:789 start_codon:yes stop_codon:yes gene_type:complete